MVINVLIFYDISSNEKRAKLHRFLKEIGINTQKSVFECEVSNEQLEMIIKKCKVLIDRDTDSILIYKICSRCIRNVQLSGKGIKFERTEYMIL